MLYGSETWPAIRVENEVTLDRNEMRMIRLMCGVRLLDRKKNVELRDSLRVENIRSVVRRRRLCWYGHVMRRPKDNWVKKCMGLEVAGVKPKGRPKKA